MNKFLAFNPQQWTGQIKNIKGKQIYPKFFKLTNLIGLLLCIKY
jgi:hypothetical protein